MATDPTNTKMTSCKHSYRQHSSYGVWLIFFNLKTGCWKHQYASSKSTSASSKDLCSEHSEVVIPASSVLSSPFFFIQIFFSSSELASIGCEKGKMCSVGATLHQLPKWPVLSQKVWCNLNSMVSCADMHILLCPDTVAICPELGGITIIIPTGSSEDKTFQITLSPCSNVCTVPERSETRGWISVKAYLK